MQERLQKIISRAGIASRRRAEELITAGQVVVNGTVITELGSKADPNEDSIVVNGKKLGDRPPELVHIAMNKPRGCVTTTDDPEGRPTVMDLLGRLRERVYPVGRLDFHSEGLLLLTNDGDFANHILSAKSTIPKKYVVKVNGMLPGSSLEKFRRGMHLEDGKTAPAKIRMAKAGPNPWYEVTLEEGRNRQIRRMFQALGFQVEKIKRIEIGPLKLGKMQTGEVRHLTPREVHFLLHPEDAPPEPQRREKRPKQIGPKKEERPTVRRTAHERIESGERIDLRLHTEVEPPERPQKPGERRAGRPAARKTAGRGGARAAGRGPGARTGGRDRPSFGNRPSGGRPSGDRPSFGGRPSGGRPSGGRPAFSGDRDRPSGDRPRVGPRPSDGPRPTVGPKSSGGPRPSGRPGGPGGGRPSGSGYGRSESFENRGRPQGPRPRDDDRGDRPRSNDRGPVRPPLRPGKRSGPPERDSSGQFRSSSPRQGDSPSRGFSGDRRPSGPSRGPGGRPSRPGGPSRGPGGRPSRPGGPSRGPGGRPSRPGGPSRGPGGRPSRPGGPSRGPRGGR